MRIGRPLLLLILGVALPILVGCNGSNSDPASNPASDKSGVNKAGGIDMGPTSPAGTVLRLWRQVAGGSPAMVVEYHPRIRELVGSSGILTVFNPAPPQFNARPQIESVSDTPLGTEVTVRSNPPGSETPHTSVYLLGQNETRWLVRFDSNLTNAVESYVSAQTQNRINPNAKVPSPQATAAGEATAAELRALFTPGPREGRLVRP